MDEILEIGRVFLHEIPQSRLPLWSEEVQAAIELAIEEEQNTAKKRNRRRGGRRGRRKFRDNKDTSRAKCCPELIQ